MVQEFLRKQAAEKREVRESSARLANAIVEEILAVKGSDDPDLIERIRRQVEAIQLGKLNKRDPLDKYRGIEETIDLGEGKQGIVALSYMPSDPEGTASRLIHFPGTDQALCLGNDFSSMVDIHRFDESNSIAALTGEPSILEAGFYLRAVSALAVKLGIETPSLQSG